MRLVDLERTGREVDEQVGPGGSQFGDWIPPIFRLQVINRARLAIPGVFADVHPQPHALEFDWRG